MSLFDPQKLVAGARLRLPGHTEPVTVIQVQSGAYWEFLVKGDAGDYRDVSLPEDELPGIEVVDAGGERRYDSDARVFRLGVEARRIRTRFQNDMGALSVSSIEPLPHQLEAVYGRFLEEPRLRFLLADDPGAGKTIMTGLYIKELQLRGAADRVLIVAPAPTSASSGSANSTSASGSRPAASPGTPWTRTPWPTPGSPTASSSSPATC